MVDPGGSVRHCCRVLGLRRASYHHRKSGHRPELADHELADLLRRTTERFVWWGFWKVCHYLRLQHLTVANHKRVYRIWRRERLNLRLPPRRPRIYRTYQELISPDGVNEGWAMDFLSDYVVGPTHKRVRIVNVMDEGSRRALWTEAFDSISARTLLTVLDQVVNYRGRPAYIRCDNGPEFISRKLRSWAEGNGIELRFIQPGKPTQNGLIERLNKRLRAEYLNLTWFRGIEELNDELQAWSQTYNLIRPHENLGHISPETYGLENQKFYYYVVAA